MGEIVTLGLFGRCELIAHTMDEKPARAIVGYVELDNRPGVRVAACNLSGEWVGHNLRPLKGNPVKWFSMRRLKDGSTI